MSDNITFVQNKYVSFSTDDFIGWMINVSKRLNKGEIPVIDPDPKFASMDLNLNGVAGEVVFGSELYDFSDRNGLPKQRMDYLHINDTKHNFSIVGLLHLPHYKFTDYQAANTRSEVIALFFGKDNEFIGGNKNDVLYGYGGSDTIDGNGGKDVISGGLGYDGLSGDEFYGTGRAGKDVFVFDVKPGKKNADFITDFATGYDKIALDHGDYRALDVGKISKSEFKDITHGAKIDKDDRIIVDTNYHDNANMYVYYDADGSGRKYGMELIFSGEQSKIAYTDLYVF